MNQNPNRIDEQLRPNPGAHALQPAHPGRQGPQSAAERRRVAKGSLNPRPDLVEGLSVLVLQQVDAVQALRALVVLAAAGVLRLATRGQQLIALCKSPVVQVAGVLFPVRQQVAPVVQLSDQAVGDPLFRRRSTA